MLFRSALETASRRGNRPTIADDIEGGYGKALLIEIDKNDPGKDVLLENTVCNPPKTYSDGKLHTVCMGKWRSGNNLVNGRSEMMYNAENRTATLHAEQLGMEPITITFHP